SAEDIFRSAGSRLPYLCPSGFPPKNIHDLCYGYIAFFQAWETRHPFSVGNGTNEANRYSESARGFARGPSIRDKDAESYQGQTPKDGFCSVGYADVRVSIPQMASCESDAEWYRVPRGGTRNKPNFTKTHEPGGNSGDQRDKKKLD
ncbi:hypothetical protein TNCV_4137461, partial [Trichonephila clavipes]